MKTAIIQSNYVPWIGYFNIISISDNFVFYDEMQYTKRDWRNRNYIKTPEGKKLLSIPVNTKGKYIEKINNITIADINWGEKHFKTLERNYKKSKYFEEVHSLLSEIYLDKSLKYLSEINKRLIRKISDYLNLKTNFYNSSEYILSGGKNENLIKICKDLNTKTYISGPFGRNYIDDKKFNRQNINVQFFDYPVYPEYNQLWNSKFLPNLSIIDCLYNCGKETRELI